MSGLPAGPDGLDALLKARRHPFAAVVIGGSAGAWDAVASLLAELPGYFPLPVAVVLHVHPEQEDHFAASFGRQCALRVKQARDKDALAPGEVVFAPPDYHLLIEWDRSCALSTDAKVAFSRPSIDVLFESAAAVYGPGLAAILLSGASRDGTAGISRINELGGLTVVQDPKTAEYPLMPLSALENAAPALALSIEEIAALLRRLAAGAQAAAPPCPGTQDGCPLLAPDRKHP